MNHAHYPDTYLRSILADTITIAIVGCSPKPERPSHYVTRFLLECGYVCIPVNPGQAGGTILGLPVRRDLAAVPDAVDMVDIFRRSEDVGRVVDEALALPALPKAIWMQIGIRDNAAAARAESAGVRVVMNRCPLVEIPRLFGTGSRLGSRREGGAI